MGNWSKKQTLQRKPLLTKMYGSCIQWERAFIGESLLQAKNCLQRIYEEGTVGYLGGLPEEATFRPSIYGLESGRTYSTGNILPSFLVNFSKFKAKCYMDFISTSANQHTEQAGDSSSPLTREAKSNWKVGKKQRDLHQDLWFEHDLIRLKIDFCKNQGFLFIDPELKDQGTYTDAVARRREFWKAASKE